MVNKVVNLNLNVNGRVAVKHGTPERGTGNMEQQIRMVKHGTTNPEQ